LREQMTSSRVSNINSLFRQISNRAFLNEHGTWVAPHDMRQPPMLRNFCTLSTLHHRAKSATMIIVTILYLLFTHFLFTVTLYHLSRNYHSARRSGLRIILSPITPYSLQWQLLANLCGSYLQRYRWYRAIDWTCCWQDNDKSHQELGLFHHCVARA
jgi:predicted ABC-type sugar transport system permease subunit